jgi:glucose/arabinose dehydrogenase
MRRLVLLVLVACGGATSPPEATPDAQASDAGVPGPDAPTQNANCPTLPALRLAPIVASGLDQPVALAFPPGDRHRIFVLEQKGVVRVVRDGVLVTEPFLDVQAKIHVGGGGPIGGDTEDGLLSIAFHPDYASNRELYLYFSDDNDGGPAMVSVWEHTRRADDPERADPGGTRIFETPHNGYNHLGGTLAFGPRDGYLYLSIGEAAWEPNAVDLDLPLGKILRIDVADPDRRLDGNVAAGHPNVWSWGLRNPFRMSFDRATGDLYIADVGWGDREEIDLVAAGQPGQDFGWPTREGLLCRGGGMACGAQGVPPVIDHDRGAITTIVGGMVYRGTAIPCLVGRYLYADFATARFFSFVWDAGALRDARELTDDLNPGTTQGIAGFAEDADGELYLVSRQQGRIYQIVAE